MRQLVAAVRFLTAVPLPGRYGGEPSDLAGSVWFFPVVGVLLGAVAGSVCWCAGLVASSLVTSAVVVIVLLAASGGLHADGLCDTADGLLSGRPRQEALEIMKDSRLGTMGAMVLTCVVLVKFASLASLPEQRRWQAAALMPVAGRCAMVMHLALLRCARPEGLASVFFTRHRYPAGLWALLVLLASCWVLSGMRGWVVAAVSVAAILALAGYFHRRLGGATGDTLGAACELVEIMPACVPAMWPG